MLTITQEIKNCEAVLNGETVNGVKLGDKGINYAWLIQHIASLREIKRERQHKAALRRSLNGERRCGRTQESV